MTLIGRVFPPAVVLQIHCRYSNPIKGVKRTGVGLILPAGYFLMQGSPRTALSRTGCSHKVGVVVNVEGLNLISTQV